MNYMAQTKRPKDRMPEWLKVWIWKHTGWCPPDWVQRDAHEHFRYWEAMLAIRGLAQRTLEPER